MRLVDRRKLRTIALDGADNRSAELTDDRIDAAEERSVGLCPAAYRLVEIFAPRQVDPAKRLGHLLHGR